MVEISKSRIKDIKEKIEKINEAIIKILEESEFDTTGLIFLNISDGEYSHNHICENLDEDGLFDLLMFLCATNPELFAKVLGNHLIDMHERGESIASPKDKSKMI